MDRTLRWAILAAGSIARKGAAAINESNTGVLHGVGSRSIEKARAFADEFGASRAYGSYEELIADPDVDAVYIATPHPFHAEWAVKCADAGKHLLIEKPVTMNHAETQVVLEAAERNGIFLMEAFMYRCHPLTAKLIELLREGAIGEVRAIESSFSFQGRPKSGHRLFDPELGGGGILDVGCYTVSMSRLIAGVARGGTFAEPRKVTGSARLNDLGTDGNASALLEFPGDIIAQISCGVELSRDNVLRIFGTTGRIEIAHFWFAKNPIVLHRNGSDSPETIEPAAEHSLYVYQVDTVARAVAADQREAGFPAMSWDDTLGNMQVLDQWRASAGVSYPHETPDSATFPVKRAAKPAAKPGTTMRYGEIDGVGKPISRLVMGVDNQPNFAHAAVLFDDFIERGGNAFDTAMIYGGGRMEKLLGSYLKSRGLAGEAIVLDKDAHTPFCWPDIMAASIDQRLENLGVDCIDLFVMHRDNLEVPVGEFVDVLSGFVEAGKVKVFGGSNWTPERIDEANAWAKEHGKQGFSLVNNNFSLARMIDPVWRGCVASSDPRTREWHEERGMPNFSWSSQARGFFTERSGPDKRSDEQLVRCWYSEENFERKRRATQLAENYGVTPLNIALAYVLAQAFPSFALVGPRLLSETRTLWPGLGVELSPEEARWLDLRAESID